MQPWSGLIQGLPGEAGPYGLGNIAQTVGTDLSGNAAVDIADPVRTAVDETGVALQEGSAGSDALPCLFWRGDAAHGDEGELAADSLIEAAQYL